MLDRSTFPIAATIDETRSKPAPVTGNDIVVCVINLDRSPERWEAIRRQIDASGLPYLRLSAFDGADLPDALRTLVDRRHFESSNGRQATASETGCYLSHVAAWTVLNSRLERFLLVVEDDAIFEPGWTQTLREALASYRGGTLLKLSWQRKGLTLPVQSIGAQSRIVAPLTHEACNAAYLIDRTAATRFLAAALPVHLPVDHFVESPWLTGVRTRTIMPALARQGGAKSTQSKPVKFHWRERVPTLLYRIKAHCLRLIHNMWRLA